MLRRWQKLKAISEAIRNVTSATVEVWKGSPVIGAIHTGLKSQQGCQCRAFQQTQASMALPAAAINRLQLMRKRDAELSAILSGQEAVNLSYQQQATYNKELGRLQTALKSQNLLDGLQQEIKDLLSVEAESEQDRGLQQMALQERKILESQIPDLEKAILLELLPQDEADDREVILEVRAGTGGEEASLFASDLFKMYGRFAQSKGWRFELVEIAEGEGGGYKMASAAITGGSIYAQLKHENGVHRVQRVPTTETQGRVHTSAASVVVMPQADEVEVAVRDDEIRIDTYRSTGAGGQHVNTTDSAVRITHLPTGIVVAIQDERSQHKNRAKALKVLRARIYEQDRLAKQKTLSEERKEIIGSGDRSERIRTYNFPQGRVTDHRIGITEHNLDAVLSGEGLDLFIDALQEHHKAKLLESLS